MLRSNSELRYDVSVSIAGLHLSTISPSHLPSEVGLAAVPGNSILYNPGFDASVRLSDIWHPLTIMSAVFC
jgi:hypothetical protein